MFESNKFCDKPNFGVILGYEDELTSFGYSEEFSLQNQLSNYRGRCSEHCIYYKQKIDTPTYEEVNSLDKLFESVGVNSVKQLNTTNLKKALEVVYPEITHTLRLTLVNSLVDTLSYLIKSNRESYAYDVLFNILKALDSTFLTVLKELSHSGRSFILFLGEVRAKDYYIFNTLFKIGANVLILTGEFLAPTIGNMEIKKYTGDRKDIMTFMDSFMDVGSAVNRNEWMGIDNIDTLEDGLKFLLYAMTKTNHSKDNYKCYSYGFSGVLDDATYNQAINSFYVETRQKYGAFVIDSSFENPTYEEINDCTANYKNCLSIEAILLQFKCFESSSIPEIVGTKLGNMIDELKKVHSDKYVESLKSKIYIWVIRICKSLFAKVVHIKEIHYVIVYGSISEQLQSLVEVLTWLPVNILHFSPNKNSVLKVENLEYFQIGLSNTSFTAFPYTLLGTDMTKVSTLAYSTQEKYREAMKGALCSYKSYSSMKNVILQTTLDEIDLYWDEIAAVRPMYKITEGDSPSVIVPTIFCKVDGVLPDTEEFLDKIREKKTKNTVFITDYTYFQTLNMFGGLYTHMQYNYFKEELDFKKLQISSCYNYRLLSEETELLIYNKAMDFVKSPWCRKKTLEDSKFPLKVLSIIFNLPEEITLLIHKFDFTGDIPKICYFYTSKYLMPIEDIVSIMFLNTLGFDVLVYTPSGFDVLADLGGENYHTILAGEYDMGMTVEDIKVRVKPKRKSFFGLL